MDDLGWRAGLSPRLKELLVKVEALVERGATPGERAAAQQAVFRIYERCRMDWAEEQRALNEKTQAARDARYEAAVKAWRERRAADEDDLNDWYTSWERRSELNEHGVRSAEFKRREAAVFDRKLKYGDGPVKF